VPGKVVVLNLERAMVDVKEGWVVPVLGLNLEQAVTNTREGWMLSVLVLGLNLEQVVPVLALNLERVMVIVEGAVPVPILETGSWLGVEEIAMGTEIEKEREHQRANAVYSASAEGCRLHFADVQLVRLAVYIPLCLASMVSKVDTILQRELTEIGPSIGAHRLLRKLIATRIVHRPR
jgi:hypothetical protein